MKYKSAREQIFETVMKANQVDLIRMSAGNISARIENGLIGITPGGIKYQNMKVEDISIVDLDGNLIDGLKPSSETPMHTAIYRHLPEVKSICHTHSTFAITFAMLRRDIPVQTWSWLSAARRSRSRLGLVPAPQKRVRWLLKFFQRDRV